MEPKGSIKKKIQRKRMVLSSILSLSSQPSCNIPKPVNFFLVISLELQLCSMIKSARVRVIYTKSIAIIEVLKWRQRLRKQSKNYFPETYKTPEPGSACTILDALRSTFLISKGKTSVWSVETTSQPSNAMPEKTQLTLSVA